MLFAKVSLAQSDSIIDCVLFETMPEYIGGNGEMIKFIAKNINYSECAKASKECAKGLVGYHKIYVNFIVTSIGTIKDAKVLKGIKDCPEADTEALRVVNLMTNWKPASCNGKPRDCKMNLPMNIMLK